MRVVRGGARVNGLVEFPCRRVLYTFSRPFIRKVDDRRRPSRRGVFLDKRIFGHAPKMLAQVGRFFDRLPLGKTP